MKRQHVLSLEPSYDEILPDRDAYVSPGKLERLIGKFEPGEYMRYVHRDKNGNLVDERPDACTRYWKFRHRPTTVALSNNRFAKSNAAFTDHTSEFTFSEFRRECASHGVERPSSYGDVFHKLYKSAHVPHSINLPFFSLLVGGWEQALSIGLHWGTFYEYDLISAYLGSIMRGIPDASTYRRSKDPQHIHRAKHGVFVCELANPTGATPFPFNAKTATNLVMVTDEEIQTYNLKIARVLDGVTWEGFADPQPIIDAVKAVSFWKCVARCFWGRWGQTSIVQCVTPKREWPLINRVLNMPLAHHVVSGVKLELWKYSPNAIHVFVDSLVTPDIIPTGEGIGQFKLKHTYPAGVVVLGTSAYGDIRFEKLDKRAGVPLDSIFRNNPVAEWKAVENLEYEDTNYARA